LVVDGPGGDEVPREAWPVLLNPGRQHALVDDCAPGRRQAFAVHRLRIEAAAAERVVDDRDRGREDCLVELGFEEAGAPRDSRAVDRAGQVADDAVRNARVIDDRAFAGVDLARCEPLQRPLGGAAADIFRFVEIG
jgi:hypothetical protein